MNTTPMDSTILLVGLLAIDGVLIPFVRWAMKRYTALMVMVVLPTSVAAAFAWQVVPDGAYGTTLILVSGFTLLYNRWFLLQSDDTLCEGVVWPKVRDFALAKMGEIDV